MVSAFGQDEGQLSLFMPPEAPCASAALF